MLNKILQSLILSTSLMFSNTVVSGDVSGTWTIDGSPYIVTSTINLVGALTIEAGIDVNFNPDNNIYLYSNGFPIYAMGTEESRITISGNLWSGIYLESIDTPSLFNYCDIYNASYNIETQNAAIEINNCNIYGALQNGLNISGNESVLITNTNIYENGKHGLYCETNNPLLDNVVSFNNENIGFSFWAYETDGYEIILSNIESYGNADGINLWRYSKSTIHHVISRHNREDGIEIWDQNGNEPMQLNNNVFHGNNWNGIRINNSNSQSERLIYNNIIINNGEWGIRNESDFHENSMFTSNLIFDNGLGANWGILGDGACNFNSGYTNNIDYPSDIFYNITGDPMIFEGDASNPDYHLIEGSPCIDAGATIDGLDPDGTFSDIGLYYYDQTEPDLTPTIDVYISSATANPGDTVSISLEVGIPDTVSIFSASLSLNCLISPLTMNNLQLVMPLDSWIGELGDECPISIWMAGSVSISGYSSTLLTFDAVVSEEAIDQAIPITINSVSFDEVDYNININEGTITIVTIPPLIPDYGDVSLNGSISPFDASMILQYEAALIGLDEQQMLNADVSGDGSISGMDASYILQYGVGLIEEFPVESGATVVSAMGDYYMDNYSYIDGTHFEIPVFLDNGSDIYSFKHQFTYDSEMILIEEITKGENIEDFIVQFNPDNSELIVVGASSDEDGITGTFFTISGSIVDENIYGTSTSLSLNEVRLNENEPDLYESNYTTLILNGTLGDINSDVLLNVLDIVTLVNIILPGDDWNNGDPASDYHIWASDTNSDGEINILDIVTLIQMILPDLSREMPVSKATIEYGNNKLGLTSDGSVSGMQLEVTGDFIITGHNLPEGWKFYHSNNTILTFNMGGENISSGILLEYEGDLSIESTIIADSYGNGVSANLQITPDSYALLNSYPNPFNPVTTINFTLPVESEISLEVYNLQGRMVELLTNGNMQPGKYSVTWNADNQSSGVYFIKMVAGEFVNTQKLMLIK